MPNEQSDMEQIEIRPYTPADQPHISRLYTEGLLEGEIPPNDTGADIENIEEAYLSDERAALWIAEYAGDVAGMIAVAPDEKDIAEIRRLRVYPDYWGKGIRRQLMQTALAFCRHHGYLKVVLDTRFERWPALELFEKFAFQHTRSKTVPGKEVLEFYLDLYRDPKSDEDDNE